MQWVVLMSQKHNYASIKPFLEKRTEGGGVCAHQRLQEREMWDNRSDDLINEMSPPMRSSFSQPQTKPDQSYSSYWSLYFLLTWPSRQGKFTARSFLSPVMDWQPVLGVPRLSPNGCWDRLQPLSSPSYNHLLNRTRSSGELWQWLKTNNEEKAKRRNETSPAWRWQSESKTKPKPSGKFADI